MKKREKFSTNCPICRSKKTKKLYKSKIEESNPYTKFLLEKVVDNRKLINCDMKLCLNCLLCFFDYRYTQKELNRFDFLIGQVKAGQNSPVEINELKQLLMKFSNKQLLPKSEVNNILAELLYLGY